MPKVTCVFNCNSTKLIPLITSENFKAIEGKYVIDYFQKATRTSPPNTFHFAKTKKPMDTNYTSSSKSFDISDDFFKKLKSISETS